MSTKNLGLLVLRLGAGGLLLFGHGLAKVLAYSQKAATFADPIGLGPGLSFALVVFAEFFCSIGLMVGLATRLAAIPIIIFMLVAAFVQHAADPWGKKELPLLYLVPAVTLLLTGAGSYSLDALIAERRASRGRAPKP